MKRVSFEKHANSVRFKEFKKKILNHAHIFWIRFVTMDISIIVVVNYTLRYANLNIYKFVKFIICDLGILSCT